MLFVSIVLPFCLFDYNITFVYFCDSVYLSQLQGTVLNNVFILLQENTYKHYYYPDEASDDDSDLALKVKKAISKRPNSIHSFFEKRKKRKTVQKSSTVSQATADGVGFIKTNEDDETFASHLIKIEVYEMSKIKNIPSTDQWKKAEVRVKYYASCDEDKNLQSARDVIYNITKQIANRKDCVNYFIDGEKQVQM